MNFSLLTHIKLLSPRPILFIIGDQAHSRYFSEDAYELAAEPKEFYIVPNADKQWLCFHSLPPEVNNFPHAFWWTYEEPSEPLNANDMTWGNLVDEYNPNTNAEIVAYLLQYRDLIPSQFPLELLKKIAVDKINTFEKELDMHAFFCYTKLWDVVDLKDKDSNLWGDRF